MTIPDIIKQKLISRLAGVTIHYSRVDAPEIHGALLKRIKNNIALQKTFSGITIPDELKEKFDMNIPVWLTVTGRIVIARKLDKDPGENYLHHILPNANSSDFCVSVVKNSIGEAFVSAVRKNKMDEIIESFHEAGFNIIGISIGPASMATLSDFKLLPADSLDIPGYRIGYKNNDLTDVVTNETEEQKNYQIGSDTIDSNMLLPFATAFAYLIKQSGYDNVISEIPAVDSEGFLYKQINKLCMYGSLILVFFLLLLNFMLFSSYSQKQQVLSQKLSYQTALFTRYDSLRAEVKLKKDLVNQMGLSEDTRFGFYTDRIASTLPAGLSLTELTVNPSAEKIKPGNAIRFDKWIILKGNASGSILLNEWVKKLKELEWIRDVQIITYEKEDNQGIFEMKIFY